MRVKASLVPHDFTEKPQKKWKDRNIHFERKTPGISTITNSIFYGFQIQFQFQIQYHMHQKLNMYMGVTIYIVVLGEAKVDIWILRFLVWSRTHL